MKNILVPYFTQSGQLKQILDSCLQPLIDAGHQVEFLQFETVHSFPFPWSTSVFFDTVPESVDCIPMPLKPWQAKLEKYADDFLKVINRHLDTLENDLPTHEQSFKMFTDENLSVAEIAEKRGLSENTIYSHFIKMNELGTSIDFSEFI